jgi:hypothetical protein
VLSSSGAYPALAGAVNVTAAALVAGATGAAGRQQPLTTTLAMPPAPRGNDTGGETVAFSINFRCGKQALGIIVEWQACCEALVTMMKYLFGCVWLPCFVGVVRGWHFYEHLQGQCDACSGLLLYRLNFERSQSLCLVHHLRYDDMPQLTP